MENNSKSTPPPAPSHLVKQFMHDVNKLYKNNMLDKILFIQSDKKALEKIEKYYLEDISSDFVLQKMTN